MHVKVFQSVLVKVAIIIKISLEQRLVPLLSGGHRCLFRSCSGSLSPFSSSLLCWALHSKVSHSSSSPGVCSFYFLSSLAVPLLCSLVEILPAAVLPWAQNLPVIPRPCTPGVLFLSLSEACKHKYKACYFSRIPPSPKRAVLPSRVSSWGASCSTGSKFQDKMKIFRGCSWFPAV